MTKDALAAIIKVYPNPVHDYLEIDLGDLPMIDISIVDMNGIQVLKISNTSLGAFTFK